MFLFDARVVSPLAQILSDLALSRDGVLQKLNGISKCTHVPSSCQPVCLNTQHHHLETHQTKEKNPLRLHVVMTKRQKSLKVRNILSENHDEL